MMSLGTWLSADPNITDLLQREHPQILARIGVGEISFLTFKLFFISETVQDRVQVTVTTDH